ncbi:MAG: HAD family phosphatase [Firmicutes bacterium]|nr:HAD family phosphatase [Bacillota bacterium]
MNCKNVIFDYGNTIVEFEPMNIVKRFGITDNADANILCEKVFDRKYWDKLDSDDISQEEFINGVLSELPQRLHSIATDICNNWITNLPFIQGMDELIYKLKQDGYKIYLLSNISKHFAENSDKIKIFKRFDGLVFSGAIGLIKPNRDIFEYILDKYSLTPSETLFIDDNKDNVATAEGMGIKSLLFDGNSENAEQFIYLLR